MPQKSEIKIISILISIYLHDVLYFKLYFTLQNRNLKIITLQIVLKINQLFFKKLFVNLLVIRSIKCSIL